MSDLGLKIEFEFWDGSSRVYTAADHADARDLVRLVDIVGNEIISAWRDDEPWFGRCTDEAKP
jgi:hypothetical protein